MNRIPLPIRLAMGFAAVIGLLLGTLGLIQHITLEAHLDQTIAVGLRADSDSVEAALARGDEGIAQTLAESGIAAQVLDARGKVIAGTPGLKEATLILPTPPSQERIVERRSVAGLGDVRLLARGRVIRGAPRTLVTVRRLAERDDALAGLTRLLAITIPVAIALVGLCGYLLARRALRPIERMRARAAAITGTDQLTRLPVPAANDEVRWLGETLNGLLERIGSARTHELAFISDASHELRTPLTNLKMELELALRGERSRGELRTALVNASRDADALHQLAEDLLTIARSDEGGLPVRPEEMSVDELLSGVQSRFQSRASEDRRTIEVTPPGALRVRVDPIRAEQALANLVENALRHGTGPIRLEADSSTDGAVSLHVLDRGAGLPDGFADRAFDRFTRANAPRSGPGAGLGLPIVRMIARAHGGDAGLSPREGGGLDAWLRLPAWT